VTQVQSSGYSIDLAIKHPNHPGRYVLGTECDGAAYHSSKTARDRDRTRQAVLESLGWTIHRIWSPDWAANKQRELEAITSRVDRLVDGEISADRGATASAVDPVDVDAIPESERGGIENYLFDWEDPNVATGTDTSFDTVPIERAASVLKRVVDKYGPIQREVAFETTVSRWQISRLGTQIQRRLDRVEREMIREGHLVANDGFL
jgi:hypothetical protein